MWSLAAAIYRLSLCRIYAELDLRSNRCAFTRALGQGAGYDPGFYFAQHCDSSYFARCWRVVIVGATRVVAVLVTSTEPKKQALGTSASTTNSSCPAFLIRFG